LKESPRRFASFSIKPRSVVYAACTFYKCRKIILDIPEHNKSYHLTF
jgi:hypothetical protein